MPVTLIDIPMDGGVCDAYLATPTPADPEWVAANPEAAEAAATTYPPVLFLMDAVGLRERIADMVQRVADEGYVVLAPNTFWRGGRAPLLDPALKTAENREARMAVLGPLMKELTPERVVADGATYLDVLATVPESDGEAVRLVGYCMGGGQAMRIAAAYPSRVGRLAGFHAAGLVTDSPSSPHLLVDRIVAPMYFGFADNDPGMTPDNMYELASDALSLGCAYFAEVYDDAPHGFTMADMPAYDEDACERHWDALFSHFQGED